MATDDAKPADVMLRGADLRRYEEYVGMVRRLNRQPTAAELRPIFAGTSAAKRADRAGKQFSDAAVMRCLDRLRRRVGAKVGARERIQDVVGIIADKAVAALDEQLEPATRSKDPRMVKAVGDLAAKTLEVAGLSREERGGGGGVHVTVRSGVEPEEAAETRRLREHVHRLEQEKVGIGGGRFEA